MPAHHHMVDIGVACEVCALHVEGGMPEITRAWLGKTEITSWLLDPEQKEIRDRIVQECAEESGEILERAAEERRDALAGRE